MNLQKSDLIEIKAVETPDKVSNRTFEKNNRITYFWSARPIAKQEAK